VVVQFLSISNSLQNFLTDAGYPAVFALALLEACCIPFPSEITFGYTGYLASQGHYNVVVLIIVGVFGEICGMFVAYFLGKKGGRPAVDRFGKYVLLTHHDLDRADDFMARHGDPAMLFGRMIPLLRAFISLVAGIGEMPLGPFAIFGSIGTVLYCTALTLAGYFLGSEWTKLTKGFTYAGYVVVAAVVILGGLGLYHRVRAMRAARAAGTVDTAATAATVANVAHDKEEAPVRRGSSPGLPDTSGAPEHTDG